MSEMKFYFKEYENSHSVSFTSCKIHGLYISRTQIRSTIDENWVEIRVQPFKFDDQYETSKIFWWKGSSHNWEINYWVLLWKRNTVFWLKYCSLCEIIVAQVNFISLNSIDFLYRVMFHTPLNCYCIYLALFIRWYEP